MKSSTQKTVLLLGNYRPTLILARYFSSAGYRVISGLEGCDGGAEYCNAVNEVWLHPSIASQGAEFAKALPEFIEKNHINLVFPVSEDFVVYLGNHPDLLPKKVAVAMVEISLVQKCLDKIFMMKLAKGENVPTAGFAEAKNHIELVFKAKQLGFPLVIRPQSSTLRLNDKKALFIENDAALNAELPSWPTKQSGLILQKKASGKRHNIYFAADRGKIYRYLHAVILRTDSPDGSGLAVEGITIKPMDNLKKYSIKLIKALNYSGIGCVQFLVDEETGKVSFLEINARIAGNHALPEYAGLKLSEILVKQVQNISLDQHYFEGKSGIKYVWTCGDIQGAKIAWLNKQITGLKAVSWVLTALLAAGTTNLHMVFSIRDPKPGLMALKDQIPNFSKAFKRVWHKANG